MTFEEKAGKTLLTYRDLHPSKEALDAAGNTDAMGETLDQLDELIVAQVANSET